MNRMLAVLKESVPRTEYQKACHYAAYGNVSAIETMYRKIVGQ